MNFLLAVREINTKSGPLRYESQWFAEFVGSNVEMHKYVYFNGAYNLSADLVLTEAETERTYIFVFNFYASAPVLYLCTELETYRFVLCVLCVQDPQAKLANQYVAILQELVNI